LAAKIIRYNSGSLLSWGSRRVIVVHSSVFVANGPALKDAIRDPGASGSLDAMVTKERSAPDADMTTVGTGCKQNDQIAVASMGLP
jgi:hypothetical protein